MTFDDEKLLPLADLLEDRAAHVPDVALAIFPGETITFAALLARARLLAKGLLADGAAPLLRRIVLFGKTAWAPALSDRALVARGAAVSDDAVARAHAGQDAEDTAAMIYTSGTTAAPKACELRHAGLQRSWRIY